MRDAVDGLRARLLNESHGWRARPIGLSMMLALAIGTVHAAEAQEAVEPAEALIPVLDALRDSLPQGRIVLDTRVFCADAPNCDRWKGERPLPLAARLATRVRGVPGNLDRIRHCQPNDPTSCRLTGAGVVLAISDPAVAGDAATVHVNVWFNTGQATAPVAERSYIATLTRLNGSWVVEKIVVDRRT